MSMFHFLSCHQAKYFAKHHKRLILHAPWQLSLAAAAPIQRTWSIAFFLFEHTCGIASQRQPNFLAACMQNETLFVVAAVGVACYVM